MLLSQQEGERLVEIAVYTAQVQDKRGSLPEDELRSVVGWAETARLNHGLLENVLAGHAFIRWDREKQDVSFTLTPTGMLSAELLLSRVTPQEGTAP